MEHKESVLRLDKDKFHALVVRRWKVSLSLTAIILVIYYGFILILAFDKELLSGRVAGGSMTLWIPVGIGVIVAAWALTGIYVVWANGTYDRLVKDIKGSMR